MTGNRSSAIPGRVALAASIALFTSLSAVSSGCSHSAQGAARSVVLCGHRQALAPSFAAILTAAAISSATLVVQPERSGGAKCVALHSRETLNLHVGDRVQFVATYPPQIHTELPSIPPWEAPLPGSEAVFSVRTSPGPLQRGPGLPGGVLTPHLIVTLIATSPGRATVSWTDCSGTGC